MRPRKPGKLSARLPTEHGPRQLRRGQGALGLLKLRGPVLATSLKPLETLPKLLETKQQTLFKMLEALQGTPHWLYNKQAR
jgi:hypothetical protein